jgi:hypothetical protein
MYVELLLFWSTVLTSRLQDHNEGVDEDEDEDAEGMMVIPDVVKASTNGDKDF